MLLGILILDIIVLAIILISARRGWSKGITTVIFEVLCFLVAIVVAVIVFRPVADLVINNTQLDEWFANGIYNILERKNLNSTEKINENDTNMSKELVKIVNKYSTEAGKNNTQNIVQYVSMKLSHLIVYIIVLILLIVIFSKLLELFESVMDKIVNLPFLKQIDKAGGCIFGLIKGFLIVYAIFAVIAVFSPVFENSGIIGIIKASKLVSFLYNDNFVLKVISRII